MRSESFPKCHLRAASGGSVGHGHYLGQGSRWGFKSPSLPDICLDGSLFCSRSECVDAASIPIADNAVEKQDSQSGLSFEVLAQPFIRFPIVSLFYV